MSKILLACLMFWVASVSHAEQARDPETLFNDYCFSCHGTGWENAPVIGDSYAWEERREKGMEVLLRNTVNGLNSMPPKGACNDCTDEELQAVIQWMLE